MASKAKSSRNSGDNCKIGLYGPEIPLLRPPIALDCFAALAMTIKALHMLSHTVNQTLSVLAPCWQMILAKPLGAL
jgi:hypothetical protein